MTNFSALVAKAADAAKSAWAKEAAYQRQNLEGGYGFNPLTSAAKAASAEYATLSSQAFWAEWTEEATAERRATWNAISKGKKFSDLKQLESEVGFEMVDLRCAIDNYAAK